jgi:hypothetical protein
MNIALSAVVIFILLLPPIAFYFSYVMGAFAKANPKLGLLEGLMLSAIVSILMHAIALLLIKKEIRFDILALLLGGDLKGFNDKVTNQGFRQMLLNFVWYNASLVGAAIILARLCRWMVQLTGWHVNSGALRIYNHWGYLLLGYMGDDRIGHRKPVEFDIIFIDALVNTTSGTMIYSGYLIDCVCFGETLDRIYLSDTVKREFKINQQNDKGNVLVNQAGEPIEIDGDTMVIPYSSIINMNFHFIELPEGFDNLEEETDEIEISKQARS